jgi:alpha-beta hydrolase superfamily lysophospholipase
MAGIKKIIYWMFGALLVLYLFTCGLLYFFQEKLIFFPQKLDKNTVFQFNQKFEEKSIKAADRTLLSGLLFKTEKPKGVIFYLHGNGGSLAGWGEVAATYTALNYDVFMLDYRGYGKSEGSINGQSLFYNDIQTAYDSLKTLYSEDKIVVLGYSIGSGLAANLAATNTPKLLILQAPYYSLTDMMQHTYSLVPTFLLKYKFATNENLPKCKMPIVIFHGNQDEVIYYESSLKLQKLFKQTDTLITLNGQKHNGMTENEDYKYKIKQLLAK